MGRIWLSRARETGILWQEGKAQAKVSEDKVLKLDYKQKDLTPQYYSLWVDISAYYLKVKASCTFKNY